MVRFSACAGASSQARRNSLAGTPAAGAKMARSWTRSCVVCSCRSRLAVRGSRCRPALSVGRRRDLAFGSLTPPSHRIQKVGGKKGSEKGSRAKTYGVTDRKRAPKGQTSEIATAGCGWWFLLAPAARHDAEERRVEKRHQTDGSRPGLLKPALFTGSRWWQARPTRPDFHELREGRKPQPNAAGKSKARR